jgi:hypothetical protein
MENRTSICSVAKKTAGPKASPAGLQPNDWEEFCLGPYAKANSILRFSNALLLAFEAKPLLLRSDLFNRTAQLAFDLSKRVQMIMARLHPEMLL